MARRVRTAEASRNHTRTRLPPGRPAAADRPSPASHPGRYRGGGTPGLLPAFSLRALSDLRLRMVPLPAGRPPGAEPRTARTRHVPGGSEDAICIGVGFEVNASGAEPEWNRPNRPYGQSVTNLRNRGVRPCSPAISGEGDSTGDTRSRSPLHRPRVSFLRAWIVCQPNVRD